MVSLILACREEQKDQLIADLWERATLGIREEDLPGSECLLHAFFDREDPALAEAFATHRPEWRTHEDRDWVAMFQDAWEPMECGKRILLAPEWSEDQVPPGRTRVTIHPGLGYGTGRHQSTRLSLEALEEQLAPGDTVLDLGCGAGILASAALRLGAGRVVACDIDPEAVTAASRNFVSDGLEIPAFIGSARSIRGGAFDLVLANINAATISHLAADLRRIARRAVILAGFTDCDRQVLATRLGAAGLEIRREYAMQEWLCAVAAPGGEP